jgi:hypothetical protein
MIATDLDRSAKQAKNGYKIKIFGRLAKYLPPLSDSEENRSPELIGVSPCNRVDLSTQLDQFTVAVEHIDVPI